MLTRRRFTAGMISAAALAGLGGLAGGCSRSPRGRPPGPTPPLVENGVVSARLVAAERPTALPGTQPLPPKLPLWTFAEGAWPLTLRLQLGNRLQATLENRLPRAGEMATIHWHGIRLPNGQDGVPYLVQPPVMPGESFDYSFVPPDTGTYFFHTHCNTVEQLGRGLMGLLIVEGDATEPYDADIPVLVKDWHLDPAGTAFSEFMTLRGAGRAGTYGTLRTVNGATEPTIEVPAAGDCRLRIVNADTTRILQLGIDGAEAAIVAVDGIAITPAPLATWEMGPAMRIDVVIRAPREGEAAQLVDHANGERALLARFAGRGAAKRKGAFDPAPLRAGRIAEPDLNAAQPLDFAFHSNDANNVTAVASAPDGTPIAEICTTAKTFWGINNKAWADRDHARLPPPLAVLERGKSYLFRLKNDSDFTHPIHIHGHTLKVLRSSRKKRDWPVHWADTVLIRPGEQIEAALVADNPGDWMFHCHIIEHQETGMMGYVRVA